MIEGVKIKSLHAIPDERGRLMEILRSDDPDYVGFGQVYLTTAYFGVVKAWHYHKEQTDNFTAIKGMVKLALFDGREGSPTRGEVNEFFLGEHKTQLIQIPPLVYHGFKGISMGESIMLNIPDRVYRYDAPDEYRLPPDDASIPYDWTRKNG